MIPAENATSPTTSRPGNSVWLARRLSGWVSAAAAHQPPPIGVEYLPEPGSAEQGEAGSGGPELKGKHPQPERHDRNRLGAGQAGIDRSQPVGTQRRAMR